MQLPEISRQNLILLTGLTLLLAAFSALWMLQGLPPEGNRSFILKLRWTKLAGLIVVGAATGIATVLFQTVAGNRVLTPSIMGFDSLYVLLQTSLVMMLGIAGVAALPVGEKFLLEVGVMTLLACILFGTLLGRGARDIPRTILTGVILGILFRSLNSFLGRVIDPIEFAVVQQNSMASFSRIDANLLPYGLGLALLAMVGAMLLASRLDVLGLGREVAVSLGLRHERVVILTLALVAVLVAIPTALVGPITFFGLLVAGMTHGLAQTARHAILLPAAGLIAATMLVAGQLLFERVMGQAAFLSVIIEFAGGLFFMYLLLKGRIR
ncbi:iron complex transport system permease protein [Paracoccus sulfuroxidans]|uniref:Iron complex transport system permease protein n=2 Tax=Paracoccus sulfuroxidans TaxID=384678 RepID=A0A562NP69_9RHOB|nr:iron complex transport system permease protein [Paracoccus sulfuroxidans]